MSTLERHVITNMSDLVPSECDDVGNFFRVCVNEDKYHWNPSGLISDKNPRLSKYNESKKKNKN